MGLTMHVNGDPMLCCKPGAWEIYNRGASPLAPPMHRLVIQVAADHDIDPHALDEELAMRGMEPEALGDFQAVQLVTAVRARM